MINVILLNFYQVGNRRRGNLEDYKIKGGENGRIE